MNLVILLSDNNKAHTLHLKVKIKYTTTYKVL